MLVLSKPFSYELIKQGFETVHPKKPVGHLEVAVVRGLSLRWSKGNLCAGATAVEGITSKAMCSFSVCERSAHPSSFVR